ncbi:hypothetical protein [Synoicihabitans lomoniglobus]|uniref:GAF domain-containing protein n=1 Tax=Synoicihabitans lomoniglobus TaxID=2909285 RepID=A0AAF0CQC5_9BACT|nr:hypothetical protein [Opitutaceae bacterium LMO-M01]WED66125.1 hypothetical protein PXH66_04610 [Opitutaceae bacterium LMO-M01]
MVWSDVGVIGLLLVGANLLLGRGDIGWLEFNPTPYLLLPILIGGRYGFGPGLYAAVAVVVGVAAGRVWAGQAVTVSQVIRGNPAWCASIVVAGAVAGELWLYFRRRIVELTAGETQLQDKLRKMDANITVLRGAKDELDRLTAARDGEISSLDADLRRLHACAATELPEEIMQLLKRQARVSDAALYRSAEASADDAPWQRFALLGREENLPATLDLDEHGMAARAVKQRSLVTLPEILEGTRLVGESALMAAPMIGSDGRIRALLIVTGMPFIAFTPAAANLVSLVCSWSGGVLELSEEAEGRYRIVVGRQGQRIFFAAYFNHLVEVAREASRKHRLPSSLVEVAWPGHAGGDQAHFERVVMGAVRSGDMAMQPDRSFPALVILLPLAGERGTDIFIDRCRQNCRQNDIDPTTLSINRLDLGETESAERALSQLAAAKGGTGV